MNNIEETLKAKLKDNNVTVSAVCLGERKDKEGWRHDLWSVSVSRFESGYTYAEDFEYRTGIGLREKTPYRGFGPAPRPNTLAYQAWEKTFTPVFDVVSFFFSLAGDDPEWQSFESWCDNFGYDSDSIKAENIFRACQANTKKILNILGKSLFAEIKELVADY